MSSTSTLTRQTEPASWDPRHYLSHAEIVDAVHHALTLSLERGTAAYKDMVDASPDSADSADSVNDRKKVIEVWKDIGQEVTRRLTSDNPTQERDKARLRDTMDISCGLMLMLDGVVTDKWSDAETDQWIKMLSSQTGMCQYTLMGCTCNDSVYSKEFWTEGVLHPAHDQLIERAVESLTRRQKETAEDNAGDEMSCRTSGMGKSDGQSATLGERAWAIWASLSQTFASRLWGDHEDVQDTGSNTVQDAVLAEGSHAAQGKDPEPLPDQGHAGHSSYTPLSPK